MMTRAYIALAAIGSTIALVGAVTPALAETMPETMVVQYSDLNLASAKGQKVLELRIDQAAKQICGFGQAHTGTRLRSLDAQKCYHEAKAQATKQFAALINKQRLGG